MLIKELVEALVKPAIQRSQLDHEYDREWDANKRDDTIGTGSGWYSHGNPGEDPHEYKVKTWLPTDLKYDAKYHWIKAIHPIMGDNPYLPVYYNIKFERDTLGWVKTNYTMENLVELHTLRIDQLRAIAAKAFNDENFYDVAVSPQMIAKKIREMIIDQKRGASSTQDIDPGLAEAIKLIVEVLKKNPAFHDDLHAGNLMARNSPYGLQLVITDPMGDEGRSIRGRK